MFYIYSADDDRQFVQHVEQVLRHSANISIWYSIGSAKNCPTEDICSYDTENLSAVFIRSYSFVPYYKKVQDTFYWINPKFNVKRCGNKLFATDSKLDSDRTCQLLKSVTLPEFQTELGSVTSRGMIKDYAKCSNSVVICLK